MLHNTYYKLQTTSYKTRDKQQPPTHKQHIKKRHSNQQTPNINQQTTINEQYEEPTHNEQQAATIKQHTQNIDHRAQPTPHELNDAQQLTHIEQQTANNKHKY